MSALSDLTEKPIPWKLVQGHWKCVKNQQMSIENLKFLLESLENI